MNIFLRGSTCLMVFFCLFMTFVASAHSVAKEVAVSVISGLAWEDMNGNGIRDVGEPVLNGVNVHLYNGNNVFIASTTTNTSGTYSFTLNTFGEFYIVFDAPATYSFTFPNVGVDDSIDNNVNEINGIGSTGIINVVDGNTYNNIDAGLYICIPIGDQVWYDFDEDDIFDINENGINGVVVNLWRQNVDTTYSLYASTTTIPVPNSPSDDGYYKFCAPPGIYYVEVAIPQFGLVSAVANVGSNDEIDSDTTGENGMNTTSLFTVTSGQELCSLGHGFYPKAKIGDRAWIDINNNGTQDPVDRDLEGVIVKLFDINGVQVRDSIITDENGMYCFDYLGKGCYYLEFTAPVEYSLAIANVGADDNFDSDIDGSNGLNTTVKYVLNPGDSNLSVDGGFYSALLPIAWADISVSNEGSYNQLTWKTLGPSNNGIFEVQKRMDVEGSFSTVELVEAHNEGQSDEYYYYYKDFDIYRTGIHYYRIKYTNVEGVVVISDVVSSSIDQELGLVAYPNPVRGFLNLDLRTFGEEGVVVDFYNAKAQVVVSQHYSDTRDIIKIDLSELPTGIYTVKTSNDSKFLSKRIFVIQ